MREALLGRRGAARTAAGGGGWRMNRKNLKNRWRLVQISLMNYWIFEHISLDRDAL